MSDEPAPLGRVQPGPGGQLLQRTAAGTFRFDVAAGRFLERDTQVDNTEIGFAGGDSVVRAVSHWNERLIPQRTEVSAR